MQDGLTPRARALRRHGALKIERASWDGRYRDIRDYVLPFSARFDSNDRNRGDRSFDAILDSSPTFAFQTLAAGMQAGVTSPARPWHRVTLVDQDLADRSNVKLWLNAVTEVQRSIFARSNTYRTLHGLYEELGPFGTALSIVDDNFDSVLWHTPHTTGEFCIATDANGRVNTAYMEYEMTVAQIVDMFVRPNQRPKSGSIDWSNVSERVKNAWERHRAYDEWVKVLRVIEPRAMDEREYGSPLAKHMAFKSCWYEADGSEDKILRESGYRHFPGLAPRWNTRGRDIYGNSPGMVALGDIKQLMHQQLRKGQGIDFMAIPPIGLPIEAKGREVEYLPGGVTTLGPGGQTGRGGNLVDIKLDLNHLLADIRDVRQRIDRASFADLFRMLSNDTRQQPITAREVAERHEEKLLMLGPVLERLHDELLAPLIDITFDKMMAAGILPPPPKELEGQDLKIEFVSTLAQAQKAVGLQSLDRLIGTVSLMAQGSGDPGVWDKLNKDELVDRYADMLAIDPAVIVADEKIAIIRQDRAKQQQAAQAAAAAQPANQAAGALKQLNEVDPNAAQDVTRALMGYT